VEKLDRGIDQERQRRLLSGMSAMLFMCNCMCVYVCARACVSGPC
jgi:hypothetical protein